MLLDKGWLLILESWAKSNNKQIRLATINALNNLLGEDAIAARIFQEYGIDLFVELAGMADIDVLHATENLLQLLKQQGYESYQSRQAPDILKLDDNFQIRTQ